MSSAALLRPRVRRAGVVLAAPGFYVAPTGSSSNPGTFAAPWSLSYALAGAGGAITPGCTVWLMLADYVLGDAAADWMTQPHYQGVVTAACSGTTSQRVIFRGMSSRPAEMPTIKGDLRIRAVYFDLRDVQVGYDMDTLRNGQTNPSTDIPRHTSGVSVEAAHVRLRNVIFHDVAGLGAFSLSPGLQVQDCLAYNCGWLTPLRGAAHAHYTQTQRTPALPADTKRFHALVAFSHFGSNGKFGGSDNSDTIGVEMVGCTSFDAGLPARAANLFSHNLLTDGGLTRKGDIALRDCTFWMRDGAFFDYTPSNFPPNVTIGDNESGERPVLVQRCRFQGPVTFGKWATLTVEDSLFTMGSDQLPWQNGRFMVFLGDGTTLATTAGWTWRRNRYLHAGDPRVLRRNGSMENFTQWRANTGLDADSTFTTGQITAPEIQLVPSEVEVGKATITIMTPPGASTVTVDVSSVLTPGAQYELHHVYDYVVGGPATLSGTYAGVSLSIPMMAKTPPTPQAGTPLSDLPPTFGVFILRTVA